MASWHGKAHVAVFVVAALATVAAPFALASRMRLLDGWRQFAGRARAFGFVTIGLLALTGATAGTSVQGLTQRLAATVIPLGVVALALRVARLGAYDAGS
jgi:hypothetical protein